MSALKKVNKSIDKKVFQKTANRTHSKNKLLNHNRGGRRL